MTHAQNQLIQGLPKAEQRALLDVCEPVDLVLAEILVERGDTTRHVYFPIDSFVSMLTQVDNHPPLEVGMVGREGMVGVQLALGAQVAPLRALVQGPGSAWRVTADNFRRALKRGTALRRAIDSYLFVLMAQRSGAAACLRFHLIGPRLARWLLMSQDRAHADHFHVTHEFLAYMLGVRRVGITTAAMALQREGLITYRRGELTVLDRPGLEAAACVCYAADCRTYADQMTP